MSERMRLVLISFSKAPSFLIFTSISFRSQACHLIFPTVLSTSLQGFIIWVDESLHESQQRFIQEMLWNHLPATFSHIRTSHILNSVQFHLLFIMIIQVASTDSSIECIQNYLDINKIGALTHEVKNFGVF